MTTTPIPLMVRVVGWPLILLGAVTVAGGIWLASLGGSPFYLASGAAMAAIGWLLVRGRPAALWAAALLVVGTLVWALWEVGVDWWPLAARGGVVFLIGLLLLTPWVRHAVGRAVDTPVPLLRGGGLALGVALTQRWSSQPSPGRGICTGSRGDCPRASRLRVRMRRECRAPSGTPMVGPRPGSVGRR